MSRRRHWRTSHDEHELLLNAASAIFLIAPLGRQVEQCPVLGLGQESIEDLFEVPRGGRVPVGAIEHTGPREDLPPRVALPFLGGFNGPQLRDPVGDLLLLLFERGPRRPQQRMGYAGLVVELVVKGGVASNTVAKSADSRAAIVTRPRAIVA